MTAKVKPLINREIVIGESMHRKIIENIFIRFYRFQQPKLDELLNPTDALSPTVSSLSIIFWSPHWGTCKNSAVFDDYNRTGLELCSQLALI